MRQARQTVRARRRLRRDGPRALLGVLGTLLLLGMGLVGCSSSPDGPGRKSAGEGEMCGSIAGISCADGLWCDPEPGLCDGADFAGTCVAVPQVCTYDFRPVCGCDGRTYGNDCTRRAAQVQKDHDGACGR